MAHKQNRIHFGFVTEKRLKYCSLLGLKKQICPIVQLVFKPMGTMHYTEIK